MKELDIKINLDKSQAVAEVKAFASAQKQAIKDVQAAEIKAAKDGLDDFYQRMTAEKKAAQEAAKEVTAAARVKAKAEKDAAKEAADALRMKVKAEKDAATAATKEATAAARAKAKIEKDAVKEHAAAIKAKSDAEEKASEKSISLAKAVGGFALSMLGIDSAKAVISAIADSFDMARESAYSASKMVTDYRESLLELAALKGKVGQTTEVTKEEIAFITQTHQKPEDARKYQLAVLGAMEAAVGNQITEDEAKKATVLGGKFQAVEGGEAGAHGRLVGMLPLLSDKKITGEQVFQKTQQLYNIQKPGQFATFTQAIDQYAKLMPLIQSGVLDEMGAMALLTGYSASPEEAATKVEQLARATSGSVGRTTGGKAKGGMARNEYIKSLGLTDEKLKHIKASDLVVTIGNAIADDLIDQEKKAAERGEELNPLEYLQKKGYVQQEDRNALLQYTGLRKSKLLEEKFLPLAAPEALPDAEKATEDIEEKIKHEPHIRARDAAFAEQVANIAVGAGQEEVLRDVMQSAFARVRARPGGKQELPFETYEQVQGLGSLDPGNLLHGYRRKVAIEAQRGLAVEAARVGVDVDPNLIMGDQQAIPGVGGLLGLMGVGPELPPAELFEIAKKVKAAGGEIAPEMEDVTEAAMASLTTSQEFEDLGKKPKAPAAGGDQNTPILKEIRDNIRPKPKAPNPQPLVGPAPVVGRA